VIWREKDVKDSIIQWRYVNINQSLYCNDFY